MKQQVHELMRTDPQLEVNVAGNGGKIGGRVHERTTDTTEEHRWSFKAGYPSDQQGNTITKADFTWTRTLLQDHAGPHRSYESALIVDRDGSAISPFKIKVRVVAVPWKWYHRISHEGSKEKDSDPIAPESGKLISAASFECLRNALQNDIIQRNVQMAAVRK